MLQQHVEEFGTTEWASVPAALQRFTIKQRRDRWFHYLDPELNHGPFTAEEDQLLLKLQEQLGRKWAKIKEKFPRRAAHMCKTRWQQLSGRWNAPVEGKRQQTKKRRSRKFGDDGDEEEEDEQEEAEGEEERDDAMGDEDDVAGDDDYRESTMPHKRMRASVGINVQKKQENEEREDSVNDEQVEDQGEENSSSSGGSSSAQDGGADDRGFKSAINHAVSFHDAGLGLHDDIFDFAGRGLTPYQGHVTSIMGSPLYPSGLSMHNSPGIIRIQKRQVLAFVFVLFLVNFALCQLFSPSALPEMTPMRPTDDQALFSLFHRQFKEWFVCLFCV